MTNEPNHSARTAVRSLTHRAPHVGSGVFPCCGLSPFEVPRTDRVTIEGKVTCRGK